MKGGKAKGKMKTNDGLDAHCARVLIYGCRNWQKGPGSNPASLRQKNTNARGSMRK